MFTSDSSPKTGHAVVIDGQAHGIWQVKNSWGGDFADAGRFKMKWDAMPESHTKFFDVFWRESDLTHAEKRAFQNQLLQITEGDEKEDEEEA